MLYDVEILTPDGPVNYVSEAGRPETAGRRVLDNRELKGLVRGRIMSVTPVPEISKHQGKVIRKRK